MLQVRQVFRQGLALVVHVAAVPDTDDRDEQTVVLNGVDDAVVPDSDPPVVVIAFHLLDSVRARVIGKGIYVWAQAFLN